MWRRISIRIKLGSVTLANVTWLMTVSKYAIRMSTRGRITLPAELRRSLGLRGGERAYWKTLANGDLELVLQPNPTD